MIPISLAGLGVLMGLAQQSDAEAAEEEPAPAERRMVKTAKQMTLGSLFDGIGGFPLAGVYAGMKPVWASEIEPFPIRVTEKRLPGMKHYGDIHRLSGRGAGARGRGHVWLAVPGSLHCRETRRP